MVFRRLASWPLVSLAVAVLIWRLYALTPIDTPSTQPTPAASAVMRTTPVRIGVPSRQAAPRHAGVYVTASAFAGQHTKV